MPPVTLRVCPNPACPFRRKFQRPAEYEIEIETCSDCDTRLVSATSSEITSEAAMLLDTLAVDPPPQQDLGSQQGDPIHLTSVPGGLAPALVALIGGGMILGHAIATHGVAHAPAASIALGAASLGFGLWRLWTRDRTKRRIERFERGFVYHVDGRRVIVAFEQITEPRVIHQVLRSRRVSVGWMIELSFRFQGKWWVVSSFAHARGEAFETWAQGICR
jgi:hypothetical protein